MVAAEDTKVTDTADVSLPHPRRPNVPIGFGAHVSRPLVIPIEEFDREHRFWDQQPVPRVRDTEPVKRGPLEPAKTVEDVRKTPLALPEGFSWCEMNITDETEANEIYTLLYNNYVEDDDACFRFNYSVDCLRWALTPPGYFADWHVGVKCNDKLVAFISGIPSTVVVHNEPIKMAEINFLCVHKRLRSKRLAPVLIREVTRRVNLKNIWQALYTAGVFLPRPIADCRYYHRTLNVKKLVDVGFSQLPARQTMAIAQRLLSVPEDFTLENIVPLEKKHVPECVAMLKEDFENRHVLVHPEFTLEEAEHWLIPREGIVEAYVKTGEDGKVTDFFSFYELPSNVIKHNTTYNVVKAAYQYYTVARTVSLKDLMAQALIAAARKNYDVFNALDLGENSSMFQDLKFGAGDGSLKYYLYNWGCEPMHPNQVGVILM